MCSAPIAAFSAQNIENKELTIEQGAMQATTHSNNTMTDRDGRSSRAEPTLSESNTRRNSGSMGSIQIQEKNSFQFPSRGSTSSDRRSSDLYEKETHTLSSPTRNGAKKEICKSWDHRNRENSLFTIESGVGAFSDSTSRDSAQTSSSANDHRSSSSPGSSNETIQLNTTPSLQKSSIEDNSTPEEEKNMRPFSLWSRKDVIKRSLAGYCPEDLRDEGSIERRGSAREEAIAGSTIDVGDFRENHISSLDFDFNTSSSTLQDHWDACNDGQPALKRQVMFKCEDPEATSKTDNHREFPSKREQSFSSVITKRFDNTGSSALEEDETSLYLDEINEKHDTPSRIMTVSNDVRAVDIRLFSRSFIEQRIKSDGGNDADEVSIDPHNLHQTESASNIQEKIGSVVEVSPDEMNHISRLDFDFSLSDLQAQLHSNDATRVAGVGADDVDKESIDPSDLITASSAQEMHGTVAVSRLEMNYSSSTLQTLGDIGQVQVDTAAAQEALAEYRSVLAKASASECKSIESGPSNKSVLHESNHRHRPGKRVSFKYNAPFISDSRALDYIDDKSTGSITDDSTLTGSIPTRSSVDSEFLARSFVSAKEAQDVDENKSHAPSRRREDEAAPGSKLVARRSSIDVSWFARKGLMSQNSFKKYKKEMKQRVIRQSSSETKLKSLASRPVDVKAQKEFDQLASSFSSYRTAASNLTQARNSNQAEAAALHRSHSLPIIRSTKADPPAPFENGKSADKTVERSASHPDVHDLDFNNDEEKKGIELVTLLQALLLSPSFQDERLKPEEVELLNTILQRVSGRGEAEGTKPAIPKGLPQGIALIATAHKDSPGTVDAGEHEEAMSTHQDDQSFQTLVANAEDPNFNVIASAVAAFEVDNDNEENDVSTQRNIGGGSVPSDPDGSQDAWRPCLDESSHSRDVTVNATNKTVNQTNLAAQQLKGNGEDVEHSKVEAVNRELLSANRYDDGSLATELCSSVYSGVRAVYEMSDPTKIKEDCTELSLHQQPTCVKQSNSAPTWKCTQKSHDIMTTGMHHFSMTQLVNIYSKLREMSLLGHASVRLFDIDVNSHQSLARKKEMKRLGLLRPKDELKPYLENTRTSRAIVQEVLEEYDMSETSYELCAKANMVYDASLLREFKSWVEESKATRQSVLADLVDSSLEVVWFSDRHVNDLIYGICVDRETATVTVVFHRPESVMNRIRKLAMAEHRNPVQTKESPGIAEIINLRAVISEELLRPRRDTKKNTITEIREKVAKIGEELTDGCGYNLTVTGHLNGGDLATIAGFYLAADSASLKLLGAVKVFTYSSAPVGCKEFQKSFKYLEERGRLMHARYTKSNELTSLPSFDRHGWESTYKHVGVNIQLGTNHAQTVDICYSQKRGLFDELFCFAKSFVSGRGNVSIYQIMHASRSYWATHDNGRSKRIRCLISLEDLYSMKLYVNNESADKGASLQTYIILACVFVSLEVALLLRMLASSMTMFSE